MTRKPKPDELPKEELEEQDGEPLQDREVMSIVTMDPQPVEVFEPLSPGTDPHVDPGPPEE